MPTPGEAGTPFDRLRAAIDEWLDAFDAESSDQIRAELASITEQDSTESILRRIDRALELLEADATRLHDRGDAEQRKAVSVEQEAMDAVRAGDDRAAQNALERHNEHLTRATQYLDDALQLKWMVNQYRNAAASIRNRAPADD